MRLEDVSLSLTFTAIGQFEIDSREQSSSAMIEESKKLLQEEARLELDAGVGQI